jgi:hypothetical protein
MHGVVAEFIVNIEDDQDGTGKANSQADKVDDRSPFFP